MGLKKQETAPTGTATPAPTKPVEKDKTVKRLTKLKEQDENMYLRRCNTLGYMVKVSPEKFVGVADADKHARFCDVKIEAFTKYWNDRKAKKPRTRITAIKTPEQMSKVQSKMDALRKTLAGYETVIAAAKTEGITPAGATTK